MTTAFGEDNSNAKLTASQALDIFFSDEKHAYLASLYGVSVWTVYAIKTGKTWGHLTTPYRRKKLPAEQSA